MVLTSLVVAVLGSAAPPAQLVTPLDAFLASPRRLPPRALPADLSRWARAGQVTSWEERLGVPTFFRAPRSGPGSEALRDQGLTPTEAARQHLLRWAPLYGVSPQSASSAHLGRLHDLGEGAIVATFEQAVGGVPVFRDRLHVVMTQRLELVALSGYLTPVQRVTGRFRLAEPAAFSTALADAAGVALEPASLTVTGVDAAGMSLLGLSAGAPLSLGDVARARKVLFGLPEALVPAWYVELEVRTGATSSLLVAEVVSADDGRVLWRTNLTARDAYTYRVWADPAPPYLPYDSPLGTDLTPLPSGTPAPLSPPFVSPQLVTLSSAPFSRNDPWLPPGATVTSGNNVEAYADLTPGDGFNSGDLRATVTADGIFDRTYDTAVGADVSKAQQQAAVTQLFYTLNFLHDWYYDRGFAEGDGNAQTHNFGRGGAEGDSLRGEAQDYGGSNNADMSTPGDGARPRMQMYLWSNEKGLVVALGRELENRGATPGFGPAVYDLTATAAAASPADGCTTLTSALTGQIAVIDRGGCTFAVKMSSAVAAGAVGVLIIDNVEPTVLGSMQGTGTLPIRLITRADGATVRAALPTSVRLRSASPVTRDGELDSAVVAHEWTHYLSHRLISDSAGLGTNQANGLGEGWSDMGAMLLVVRGTDAQVASNAHFHGVYALATYAAGSSAADSTPYFGLRRYPYSTDLSINPLTFKHIQDGVALPTTAPTQGDPAGTFNSEVHDTGEVWAVMLWDCYAALLDSGRLPFEQARDRMQRYLVASLKATPSDPTFVEARDALLAVAAATDPLDEVLFQAAFARRGLGLAAVAPPKASTDNSGLTESFSAGSELTWVGATLDDSVSSCDHDGILDANEKGRLTLVVKNIGVVSLGATTATVTSRTPGVTITPATVALSSSTPFSLATGTAELALVPGFSLDRVDLDVTWTDPQLAASSAPRSAVVTLHVNLDVVSGASTTEGAETPIDVWTHSNDQTRSRQYDWTIRDVGPLDRALFGLDAPSPSDLSLISPVLQVGTDPLVLTFQHRWDFEVDPVTGVFYDGATVELRANGGPWTDAWLGSAASRWTDGGYDPTDGGAFVGVDGGYTGVLDFPGSNPLVGRPAYVGTSPGYPGFVTSVLDLGTSYAGQALELRLRVGSDDAAAAVGWDVTRLSVAGLINTPFPGFARDRGQCVASGPIANPGPDLTVDEGSLVTLDSSRSSGGLSLIPQWVQTQGPAVLLTKAPGGSYVFQAPQVRVDTTLTFELSVASGVLVSGPVPLLVHVRNVNHAPTVGASGPATAVPGAAVTLGAEAADPDGDSITLSWSQTSGPQVVLRDPTTAHPSFTAPSQGSSSVLRFTVQATDGRATGTSTVEVAVSAAPSCGCQSGGATSLLGLTALLSLQWRARRRRTSPRFW